MSFDVVVEWSLTVTPKVYSSIAQLVEQAAVNRWVVGSSPTRGVFDSQTSAVDCITPQFAAFLFAASLK